MAESKKRAADSEGPNQLKKPKFEKKTAPKTGGDHKAAKNPFKNAGKVNARFHDGLNDV